MRDIDINLGSLEKSEFGKGLESILKDEKISEELKDALEKTNMSLNLYLNDEKEISISETKNEKELSKKEAEKNNIQNVNNETVKNETKKESMIKKVSRSFCKVFEEFFDSMMRKFLKEKYKMNYSVYNDSKKAYKALSANDTKTFWKKGSDAVLNAIKKIPANTKKIIKNTKNTAIDEIYSWSE